MGPEETARLCELVQTAVAARRRLESEDGIGRRLSHRLISDIRAGDVAEQRLVRGHERLVTYLVGKICRQMAGAHVDPGDALQAGWFGFIDGIRRYDPGRKVALSTFVNYYIREQVLKVFRDAPQLSGAYGGDLHVMLRQYADYLERMNGRPPHADELSELWNRATVARYLSIEAGRPGAANLEPDQLRERAEHTVRSRGLWLTPERVSQVMARNEQMESLHRPLGDDERGATAADLVTSGLSAEDEVLGAVERAEQDRAIDAALARLGSQGGEDLAFLLTHHFGLKGNPPESIEVVAAAMGIHPQRAKQRLEYALIRLRTSAELRQLLVGAS